MTNRQTLRTLSVSICCLVAALLYASPVRAQSAHVVDWNCLTTASGAGSLIGTPILPAGCVVPGTTWNGPSSAQAIVPPGAPAGLTASAIGQTVALNWKPSANGGAASTYVVQAGRTSGASDLVNTSTESDLTTLTVTNVPNGTYFFRVQARSANGTSTASNEVTVRVGSAAGMSTNVMKPNAVCIVPPPPTSFSKQQNGNISVLFVWAAGEGDCQAFALPDSYSIDYGTAPGQTAGSLVVGAQPTNLTVSLVGVGAGIYYIRVRAHNVNGYSLPSNELTLIVGGVCSGPPLVPINLAGSASGNTIVLSWDDPTAGANVPTSYRVLAGIAPGTTLVAFGSSLNVFRINEVPSGSYYFRVLGVNSCGISAETADIFVIVGGVSNPSKVTGVHQFAGAPADGANLSTITLGSDGNFYGTSVSGGPFNSRCVANLEGCGVIWRMTPAGALTVLFAFGSSSPVYSYSRLVLAPDGNFWGTTTGQEDGNGAASLFKMTPAGAVTFVTELGGPSYSALALGPDGQLWGTTVTNGPGTCSWRSTSCLPTAGSGTIFKVTTGGAITYMHTFTGPDGTLPYAGLLRSGDGFMYGTTSAGGAQNVGTVYRIATDGTFTTIHHFQGGADGANPSPYAPLIQPTDGFLWGVTQFGGDAVNSGTVFKMTTAGALTSVHKFTGKQTHAGETAPTSAQDGLQPGGGLLQGPDGNIYGLAGGGGPLGAGTAFQITLAGAYTQLYGFGGSSEGGSPTATFVLGPDGLLWTTTQYGGTFNRGTVSKMTIPK
jgi:uncharacterized repeat protein (TIGR03803 family)